MYSIWQFLFCYRKRIQGSRIEGPTAKVKVKVSITVGAPHASTRAEARRYAAVAARSAAHPTSNFPRIKLTWSY